MMRWSWGDAVPAAVVALGAALLTVVIATTGSVVIATTDSDAGGVHRCDGKPATIVNGPRDGDVGGTDQADVIVAGGGDDFIGAGPGRDRVCAGPGNDIVYGGEGGDPYLRGGKGRDLVVGHGGGLSNPAQDRGDYLRGGTGDDSGVFNFRGRPGPTGGLVGGKGNDTLDGGSDTDSCEGVRDRQRNCEI